MTAPIVQVNYPTLQNAAQKFQALAQQSQDTTQGIRRCAQDLIGGGWEGQGIEAFEAEMTQRVLPRLQRLEDSLRQTNLTIHQIMKTMQEAEENAKRLLDGEESASEGGKQVASGKETAKPMQDGGLYDKNGNPIQGDPDVIFIPGIRTSADSFKEGIGKIEANWAGKNVGGIYNKSDGTITDMAQAFGDRFEAETGLGQGRNPAVEGLAKQILADKDGKIELVAHSQGSAITAAAMQRVKELNPDFDFSQVKVTTFGGFGTDFPPGADYHHYVHAGDPVPFIAAGTDFKLHPGSVDGYYGKVTVIADGDFNLFNDHDMDQYLKNKPRFEAAEQSPAIRMMSGLHMLF